MTGNYARDALFRVAVTGGRFLLNDGRLFDDRRYSRYKYGDLTAARAYGNGLARKLWLGYPDLVAHGDDLVVMSAAYKQTPTAAHAAFAAMHDQLAVWGSPVRSSRIYRHNLTEGDYGQLPQAQRERLMASNGLSTDASLVRDRHVVVVDDIRITGSHEASVERLLGPLAPASLLHLYIVVLDPTQALVDPTLEDKLNHADIADLRRLGKMLKLRPFVLNARTVKFILSPAQRAGLPLFVRSMSTEWLESVLLAAVADGYDGMATYRPSFQDLELILSRRKTPLIGAVS